MKLVKNLKNWARECLKDTYEHYLCFLPYKKGNFSSFMLKIFFSGIKISKEQLNIIKDLPPEALTVFAVKKKNSFERLFYYSKYGSEKLQCPEISFDHNIYIWQPAMRFFRLVIAKIIYFASNFAFPDPYKSGYIKDKMLKKHSAIFYIVNERGLLKRFLKEKPDPAVHLIEIQKTIERPIYIVPQLMFFGRAPMKSNPTFLDIFFGTEANPKIIRKLMSLFKKNIFVEISEPLNLKDFILQQDDQDNNYIAVALRRSLTEQIDKHRQSITGPMLKTKEEMKEEILNSKRLRPFIDSYAKKENIKPYKKILEADSYLDEIAARYTPTWIKILSYPAKWALNTMFEGTSVKKEEINKIKSISRQGPMIFIPCHRSHIDYIILTYILYINNMPSPHIAAGKNLSFWPMGPISRNAGAFFLRRTFKGEPLYSKVFSEYIYKLLEEGFNIEFFIEGGRSRTGKMILPKLGLLSMIIDAYKENACENVIFVPVYIGYDRVIEEDSYLNELEGGQKKDETFSQVIKARKFLKKKYGRIYIKFNEPIMFKSLLQEMDKDLDTMTDTEQKALCRNLGYRIINAINKVTVVTPLSITAAAILNNTKKRFSRDLIEDQIQTYINYLSYFNATLADTLIVDQKGAIDKAIDMYLNRKFIERIFLGKNDDLSDDIFTVDENKRPNLEYYKNANISFFIPGAITALSVLEKDAFQFSSTDLYQTYKFIQDLFKYEFAYDIDMLPEAIVRKNIKAFIDEAIIIPHPKLPDTYNMTSSGFRKLNLFAIFLKPYFESYIVVLNSLLKTQKVDNSSKETGIKDRLKKIESQGNKMYKKEEIDRKESLSKLNYSNGLKFFMSRGIYDSNSSDKINYYINIIRNYLDLVN